MGRKAVKGKDFDVDIYGEQWRVCYTTPVIVDGVYAYGLCDRHSNTIYIDSTLNKPDTAHTFLHELFHAYWHRMGIVNTGIPAQVEEVIADQYTKLVTEIFDFEL